MVQVTTPLRDTQLETSGLEQISRLDAELFHSFYSKISVQPLLSRSLVSNQANKSRSVYRWYKFKEAFSAALVEHFLHKFGIETGRILDPFAGSGTSLFAASVLGLDADGIEVLPIGHELIASRLILQRSFTNDDLDRLRAWSKAILWEKAEAQSKLNELRITAGAYPPATQEGIGKYFQALKNENPRLQSALKLALLCVLEEVSYTRKDGQYLRWDARSGRRQGTKPFNKGRIPSFEEAIARKTREILSDLSPVNPDAPLLPREPLRGQIQIIQGSSLNIMPTLSSATYEAIITSPPYCNRYDYTRTYALELALLGIDEQGLIALRQAMLSCTVENREKDLLGINPRWQSVIESAKSQPVLTAILKYLNQQKDDGILNNSGIPRMVKGYFFEMACIIAESLRVLKPGAPMIMVNDNVRYAGASISVDLILSDIAQGIGFEIDNILVLPRGKGNSSQQMGQHGREPLRKCIYIWRKPSRS